MTTCRQYRQQVIITEEPVRRGLEVHQILRISTHPSQDAKNALNEKRRLGEFTIGAVTEGQDALGEVSVVVEIDGMSGAGQGVSTDIIDAAARAYVRALSVARARALASADAVGLPEPAGP